MKFFNLILIFFVVAGCSSERSPYWGQELAEFRVSAPSVEESRVLGYDEFGIANKKNFMFQACLSDLSGSPLPPGLVFDVRFGSGETVSTTTNINSCIKWEREIGFSARNPEKNYLIKTSFVSKNKLKGTLTLDLLLNPLSSSVADMRNRTADQMRDVVQTDPKQDRVNIADITTNPSRETQNNQDNLKRSNVHTSTTNITEFQVNVNGFTIEKRRLDITQPYSIDQDLNLYTHNDFRVSASPTFLVKRFNNQIEKLTPDRGEFTITVAFLSEPDFEINDLWKLIENARTLEDIKKARELSQKGVEFKLNVDRLTNLRPEVIRRGLSLNDKRILMARLMLPYIHQTVRKKATMTPDFGLIADLNIPLKQDSLFQKRAMIAVTVEPHFNDTSIQVKTDGAGFVTNMFAPTGVTHFLPLPIEADLIHRERELHKRQNVTLKPLERFKAITATEQNYIELAKGDVELQNATEKFFESNDSRIVKRVYLEQLCQKMFQHSSTGNSSNYKLSTRIANCKNVAESVLKTQVLDFVEELANPVAELIAPVVSQRLSISQSFSKTSSTSRGAQFGTNLDIGLGFGLPDSFSPISGGFKALAGTAYAITRSKSGFTSATLSSEFTLNIEPSQFGIDLITRRCLVIETRPEFIKGANAQGIQFPSGAYICSEKTKHQSVLEKYYFISQNCSSTAIVDCSADQVSRFNIIVRGEQVYKKFQEMVTNSEIETLLVELSEDQVRKQIQKWAPDLKANLTNQVYPGAIAK
jgi:hypothetical protein